MQQPSIDPTMNLGMPNAASNFPIPQQNHMDPQFSQNQKLVLRNPIKICWQSQGSYETFIDNDRTRIHLYQSQYSRHQIVYRSQEYVIYNIRNAIYQHAAIQPSNNAQLVLPNANNIFDLTPFTQGSYNLTFSGYYGSIDIDVARPPKFDQAFSKYSFQPLF